MKWVIKWRDENNIIGFIPFSNDKAALQHIKELQKLHPLTRFELYQCTKVNLTED